MKNKLLFLAMGLALSTQMILAQVPSYVPTNGLVGYWPFNGDAKDQSGSGNNGIVDGATLTTDRFGNVNSNYNFDGINDYITIPNSNKYNFNSYTISLWVKKMGAGAAGKEHWTIISKNSNDNRWNDPFHITHTSISPTNPFLPNQLLVSHGGGSIANILNQYPNFTLQDGIWNSIIVVYDKNLNNVKTYINGNLLVSTFANYNFNNTSSIKFGVWEAYMNFFNGQIDDIGIWNRALTQDEITSLYYAENTCQSLVINTGVLSFNPPTYQNTVTIYPNPANDQITIDCGTLANVTGWKVKISNALGQEVFTGAMNTQQHVVPLNSWGGQGIYFVKIYDASNNLMNTKKIILQ